ncbi:uncharacterized protein L969DRAFT_201501 [Mixia osmundae IAM 14324]|uniref:Uncharacterized protein n=1 Tax=Mixia osmundae (strain CBS 9802 / IAM 14324 / JCM 22182 / KY 12970) TaxID=764103 RepID=G7DUV1_MIXOS|nr:uncharacterized protein L969DRAFT_201501 [Mixia osmundae IAM 14324]KEI37421.1 hypothetical protein L969DRAFT_201501 [Mixia osmundae IAM 14324]GAA94361.1 hypothetical protein E5Q_01012 [Mixia osmundae IAM 14324]
MSQSEACAPYRKRLTMAKHELDLDEPLLSDGDLREPSRVQWRSAVVKVILAACSLCAAIGLFGGFTSLVLVRHGSSVTSRKWSYSAFSGQVWSTDGLQIEYRTTLVSALFLDPNDVMRHPPAQYFEWLGNFLRANEQPIVFYTSPDLVAKVQAAHGPSTSTRPLQIVTVASALTLPPILELGGQQWLQQQWRLDPEQRIHSTLMYAVWMSKAWFLERTTKSNPFKSERFFWVDAGAFRSQTRVRFSDLDVRLDEAFGTSGDRMMLSAVENLPMADALDSYTNASAVPLRANLIQGAWFGGSVTAVSWWAQEMHRVASTQTRLGRFAAKEQDIMNLAALINRPRLLILMARQRTGECGTNPWFVFTHWADGRTGAKRCEPSFLVA